MPIWLRRFVSQSIQEAYEKEKEAQEEAMNKMNGVQKATPENTQPLGPNIKPTYTTRTSKS